MAATPASNAQWDFTSLMPNFARIMSADAGDVPVGGTVTTESDDTVYGASTKVQRWNTSLTPTWAKTLATPIDMTAKSLALLVKATAPEQSHYNTGTLNGTYTMGATSITFNAGHGFPAHSQVIDLGGGNVIAGLALGSNVLTGVTVVSGTPGTVIASGATAVQSDASITSPFDFVIQLAASLATIANRYEIRPVAGGYGGWTTIVGTAGLAQGTLGPEMRIQGTGCDLTSVGYIKITASAANSIPRSDAGYEGPQPTPTQMEIKWDSLFSFDRTTRRKVSFTFDDGTATHYSIVADEMQKALPGFPNGMRGSFPVIMENIELGATDNSFLTGAQLQALSTAGHGIALHADRKAHHQAEQDDLGGSFKTYGRGPLSHWDAVAPGNALASLTAQISKLAAYGIGGPFSLAWPQSAPCAAAFPQLLSHGIYGCRTLAEGGATTTVTNGATTTADITGFDKTSLNTRFIAWPPGDIHKLPASPTRAHLGTVSSGGSFTSGSPTVTGTSNITTAHVGAMIVNTANIPGGATILAVSGSTVTMSANALATATVTGSAITVGDHRGERAAMRGILEACKQGMSICFYSHQMSETGSSVTANQWTRDQFSNVLKYISDVKAGTNVYGNNSALDHYSDLDVVPFAELVSGLKVTGAQVASVTIKRSDVFPPGTVVGVYAQGAGRPGQPPTDAAIASGTVDSAGVLSVQAAGLLLPGVGYVAYAQVNGEHRYVRARSSLDGFDRGEAVGTGDTTSGSKTVGNVVASAGSFRVGQVLAGPGIQSGSRIQDISGSTLTLDQSATATASGVALAATGAFSWRAAVRRRRSAIGTA